MKFPQIFELTKREQRAVILILFAVLAIAVTKHYLDLERQVTTLQAPFEATAPPTASPLGDEDAE